jgi:hypothetical protein
MSSNVLNRLESVPSTTTLKRAHWEAFAFTVCPNGVVNVTNASYGPDATGHTYSVRLDTTTDADDDGVPVSCSCPHHQHRDASCKHMVAVAITEPVRIAATHAGRDADADAASAQDAETDAHADPRVLTDGGREPGQTTFTGAWHPAQETLDATAANDAGGDADGDARDTPDDEQDDKDASAAGGDDVPEECMCDGLPDDFPCWPCYRAGRKPLPSDDEDDADRDGHAHSISGPYVEAADDGSLTGRAYYRCEDCGKEAMTCSDLAAFDCAE